jgi:hypothetical protein
LLRFKLFSDDVNGFVQRLGHRFDDIASLFGGLFHAVPSTRQLFQGCLILGEQIHERLEGVVVHIDINDALDRHSTHSYPFQRRGKMTLAKLRDGIPPPIIHMLAEEIVKSFSGHPS